MKRVSSAKVNFLTVLLICLNVMPFTGLAQKPSLNDTLQKINQMFSHFNTHSPGAVISITRKGKPLYQKAFGMADLEHDVINTTETIFEAGSVSKQFTAAAVLLLVREGKISLEDNITKYFPDFPAYGSTITIEHLLHHTSGLRDWGSVAAIGGWPRSTRVYTPAHVKEIIWRQKELNFLPGSEYNYSNSNYNLLVFLVEKASGQPHQEFTRERLFRPLGMNNTKWRDNYREVIPGRAIAYSRQGDSYRQNMPFENTFGHGALLTTVGDLEKWNQRWKNNGLGIEINRLQKIKGKLNNGREIVYARGVIIDKVNNSEEIFHDGATAGYRAWLAYYPEKEISVAILSNYAGFNPAGTGKEIAEIFLGKATEQQKPDFSPAPLNPLTFSGKAGLYKSIRGNDLQELIFEKDSLRFKNSNLALIPFAENKFFLPEGFVMTFNGNSNMLMQNPRGDTGTYTRVNAFLPSEEELKSFTGTYISEEADVKIVADMKDGKLRLFRSPDAYTVIQASYTDAFFDDDVNLYKFLRNKKKKITGFTFSTGRVRNLLFRKIN